MKGGTINSMEPTVSVTRDGYTAQFLIAREDPDGSLVLRPHGGLEEAHRRHGGQRLSAAEFDELVAPHLGAADGEG